MIPAMHTCTRAVTHRCLLITAVLMLTTLSETAAAAGGDAIQVEESDDAVRVETDALRASIPKKGYVTGIGAGTFVDKKTGARDLGFGLHVWDFLMAPG